MNVEEIRSGGIDGLLSPASKARGAGLVMAHGAGGNARAAFLEKLAGALAEHGIEVLRINLPFRQRHAGPPRPADAALDREGIREAIAWMRARNKHVFAGGHSYGGRQTSMMAAEDPQAADLLLFTSYPLHPPGKPESPRTEHWPRLRTPAFFVHGTKDAFGSIDEMQSALPLISARHELFTATGQGHSLGKLDFVEPFLKFAAL
jgi:predicted alpha/beta-hydrolase family hydrolase